MKFIYVFNPDVAKDLQAAGLKIIKETNVGDKPAFIFENRKDIFINKYQKNEILLSNKMFF